MEEHRSDFEISIPQVSRAMNQGIQEKELVFETPFHLETDGRGGGGKFIPIRKSGKKGSYKAGDIVNVHQP